MAGEGNEIADRTLEQIGKEMRKLKENSKELEPSEERRNAAEEKVQEDSGTALLRKSKLRRILRSLSISND